MEPTGERSTKKGVKESKGTGAAGKALKSVSRVGSTKCGVMVSSSLVPPFLERFWFLVLITEHSGGFLLLWLLMKTNIGRISLPAQHCCDQGPHVPAQGAPALPFRGILYLPPQPKSFCIRVFQQRTTTASSCSKGRWHKSWWGWLSAVPAPGMLKSTAELSSAIEVPMQGINCPELGSGWLNPGMNLYVLCKRVQNHKWCQEALAGPQPSGNCGQAIAKKYISRRVPTLLRLGSVLAERRTSHPSKLAPSHPPSQP